MDVNVSVDNIDTTSMRCHINAGVTTRLYNASMSWLITEASPSLQSGSVDTQHFRRNKAEAGDLVQRINFKIPFSAPPRVFVAISGFGINGDHFRWDMSTLATGVDSRGFTLHILKPREGGKVRYGQVNWLAFPEGGIPGAKMCCGDLRKVGPTGSDGGQRAVEGHVEFDVEFTKEPKIFVALNQFDSARHISVKISCSNITQSGMDWKIRPWGDTTMYKVSGSYLAVGC